MEFDIALILSVMVVACIAVTVVSLLGIYWRPMRQVVFGQEGRRIDRVRSYRKSIIYHTDSQGNLHSRNSSNDDDDDADLI